MKQIQSTCVEVVERRKGKLIPCEPCFARRFNRILCRRHAEVEAGLSLELSFALQSMPYSMRPGYALRSAVFGAARILDGDEVKAEIYRELLHR